MVRRRRSLRPAGLRTPSPAAAHHSYPSRPLTKTIPRQPLLANPDKKRTTHAERRTRPGRRTPHHLHTAHPTAAARRSSRGCSRRSPGPAAAGGRSRRRSSYSHSARWRGGAPARSRAASPSRGRGSRGLRVGHVRNSFLARTNRAGGKRRSAALTLRLGELVDLGGGEAGEELLHERVARLLARVAQVVLVRLHRREAGRAGDRCNAQPKDQ
jgi:hypothetical protein